MSSRYQERGNRKSAPDHGHHFVPGGEAAPNRAPQPLDHFKRGYRERADQRERETEFLNGDFDHLRRPPEDRPLDRRTSVHDAPRGNNYPPGGSNVTMDRRSFSDRGDDRGGRGQIIMGLDVQSLVDRLCRRESDVFRELDVAREEHQAVFQSGKAVTAIISNLARRRNLRLATIVWEWIDSVGIKKNTFHYNSMISVCEKVRDYNKALQLLEEMEKERVDKNEVTFSSAISACEKCGQWRTALDLLDQMKKEGAGQTAIAYNAAISACEKGLVPHKALEIFEQMKKEGVKPTVVTYSALISAAEKGQQWKLALEVLEEMKAAGHGANVIAYSAAISALSKGQMWHKALELFREIEATGGKPSIVTYNATMTALEKGLQWERALDLFDEMKSKNMPVTVVSYGSAISACEKGLQYRQCLEYLDEMTEMGIKKNVIIFGAAMSCMEKSCRADIAFQLMERMKFEGVAPNVHIYNSAISACARCCLWEKGYELFQEMDKVGVARDVVTYNAVLDAVCSQVELGRRLFKEGVEKGFYSRVSRLGTQWLELDLHFLSLGGGEIALGWWFEECLVPYLVNTSKLEAVQSISIVTGYGKTRSRGARMNDDGMRLRVRAMLKFMKISEISQPNKGRIHINKAELIEEVKKNGGKINFDLAGYARFKEEETTANKFPDVPQRVRPRFRPVKPGEGPPGTFVREGALVEPQPPLQPPADRNPMYDVPTPRPSDSYQQERRESRRLPYPGEDRGHRSDWPQDRSSSYLDRNSSDRGFEDRRGNERQGHYDDDMRRGNPYDRDREVHSRGYNENYERGRPSDADTVDRRGSHRAWDRRGVHEHDRRHHQYDSGRHAERAEVANNDIARQSFQRGPSYYDEERYTSEVAGYGRDSLRDKNMIDQQPLSRDLNIPERSRVSGVAFPESDFSLSQERSVKRQRHSMHQFGENPGYDDHRIKRASDSALYVPRPGGGSSVPTGNDSMNHFANVDKGIDQFGRHHDDAHVQQMKKRGFDDDQKPAANRGYSIEPAFSKRRSL